MWFCLCGRDYLTKLLPGYLHVFLYASEEEYGGLMVIGEICIAINQYLVIFCRLAFLALELEHIVWRLHILDLKRKRGTRPFIYLLIQLFFFPVCIVCFVRKKFVLLAPKNCTVYCIDIVVYKSLYLWLLCTT